MTKFQTPRGTRDFLPQEMARRRNVFRKIRKVYDSYGYGEVCTPAFEDFELLAKKSGPEIEKEIYAFRDKSGRKLGLRFDPTVPICRIVAANPALPRPIKFYYITNMWRYDRPGAGRFREFWQAGVELIGSDRPEADAEILATVYEILKAAGAKNFYFRINSRKVVEAFAKQAGITGKKKADVFRAIDKLDKIGEKGVMREMKSYGIAAKPAEKFMKLIKSGSAPKEELKELEEIKQIARAMGVDNIKIDFSVVRGIDYYTGFVFETIIKGSENLGSVAGGGRYDSLIGLYSGADTPATGYGIGIDRLMEALDNKEDTTPVKTYVIPVTEAVRDKSMETAKKLRKSGISADTDLMGRNLKRQLEYADAAGIPYAVIVGEKELKKGKFVLKDMAKKTQKDMSITQIIKVLGN